ncbi:MAG: ATP synthase F1 subunit gamma [Deltaproteobacteria bacterium]|nr:ATP synthase F1 subunit gamma [Deltaproteobacteria bacterium]
MANLKDIRRRISSVEKTQQITSAMRMVAAAKLRRATDAIVAARPYADRMRDTLAEVAASGGDAQHPLLEARAEVERVEVVVLVSDRGLCGAFNSNVLKAGEAVAVEREAQGQQVTLTLIGRKANDFFKRRRAEQIGKSVTGIARVEYGHASEVAGYLAERFVSGEADEVVLAYSEFVSTMTQTPRTTTLLPFAAGGDAEAGDGDEKLPYDIEPSPEKLLQILVPKALEVQIFRSMLENQAGEHAARMTSMESATRNTEDLIESLTLQYNRARQAAITRELVEIVSGAEAL